MKKKDAIVRAGRSSHLDTRYVQFSNINVAKDVWWIDVPLSRLDDDGPEAIDLLLYDDRYNELHHLAVPTAYLRHHLDRLNVRPDRRCMSLELDASGHDRFRSVRPVASGVTFAQYLVRTV